MFYLNMVNYPVFILSLSTWLWDTFLRLRGTQGWYLFHVLPIRPSKLLGGVAWMLANKSLETANRVQIPLFWILL